MFSFLNFRYFRYASRSGKWSTVRKEHLKKQPACAACGKTSKLEVHHIKPVHKFPELELDPDNLITLCADPCHIIFGHLKYWKSWNAEVVTDCHSYYTKLKNRP